MVIKHRKFYVYIFVTTCWWKIIYKFAFDCVSCECVTVLTRGTEHKKSPGLRRHPKQRWSMKRNLNPQQRTQAAKRSVVLFMHECKMFQYPNTNSLWWLKLLFSSLREFLLQLSGSVMNFHCLIIMQISIKCVTKCWLCLTYGGSTHQ